MWSAQPVAASEMGAPFWTYRSEIYAGHGPVGLTTDASRLESSLRDHMAPELFEFVAAGAGTGATVRANREAFDRWRILPRVLRGTTVRSLVRTVLGTPMSAPLAVAPIGVQNLLHPDGELATARAAARLGLPFVLSTMASRPFEQLTTDGPRWFQLYRPNDDALCLSLLRRAAAAGFSVLVVTVDCWTDGWRTRMLDRGYSPFTDGAAASLAFTDQCFCSMLDAPPQADLPAAIRCWSRIFEDVDRTWDDVAFLRQHWDGPIALKGILHPDDARRALDACVDGIVVSNHGGRQVDGAVAALDALPDIVAAVGDRLEVLFDSGIRSGADIFKALALGARAVLVGRPVAFGLAHSGERGVTHVLRSLLADLDLTVGLSGLHSVDDIDATALSGPTR